MVVREKNDIYSWKVVKVNCWILNPLRLNTGTEMDVVSGVQKVRICHESNALPLEYGCGISNESDGRILASWYLGV